MDIQVRAEKAGFSPMIDLAIRTNFSVVRRESVVFDSKNEGECYMPTLSIPIPQAQVLIDDLWRAGLRPSEGTGSAGSLAATERHLKDLQKIVYKKLSL